MNDYRVKLIELLNQKVEEGMQVIEKLTVADKEYASAIMNILNSDKTAKELEQQIKFDEEMKENENNKEEE